MASPTPSTLPSLYRHLLRTSRSTFQGDQRMLTAWRQFVRQRLPEQAGGSSNAALPDEVVKEWLDVAKMLRMNVVQGVKDEKEEVYRLRFTSDTELGTNESIKQGREQQLADLKASKGVLGCGGGSSRPSSSSSPSTSSSSSSARAFSTSSRLSVPRDPSKLKSPRSPPLPHPPAHFPSITLLADGSSISLHTTSPRSSQRLTRDPTNHPLWNPSMDARAGSGGEDEAGRMERFRKRFAEVVQESQGQEGPEGGASGEQGQEQEVSLSEGEAEAQEAVTLGAAAGGRKKKAIFEMEDLDWMSEGGRQAKAAAKPVYGKGGAGGKRK